MISQTKAIQLGIRKEIYVTRNKESNFSQLFVMFAIRLRIMESLKYINILETITNFKLKMTVLFTSSIKPNMHVQDVK